MARHTTRVGRRRRVLNEEVLSATNIPVHRAAETTSMEPGDTPRYGVGANIENHPQITSFVPRRFRLLGLIALAGLAIGGVTELIAYRADDISELLKVISPTEITEVFASRFVAWTSAAVLLLTAGYMRLIYSLRKHRIDDNRGRYRVWRTASYAAILLSLNSVVGGHEYLSRYLGHLVDWQMLPQSVGWWLIPTALLGTWLLIKLTLEAAECRGALAINLMAIACLATAGVHSAGWSPTWTADCPELLSRSVPLMSYTLLLVSTLLFARYVILDVQGLIEHPSSKTATTAHKGSEAPKDRATADVVQAKPVEEKEANWVDGSEPEEDDNQPARRLSKAERKRLRKQKNRNRAA